MAKTDVTLAQVSELREMANAKGVSRSRFQEWLVQEAAQVLDTLRPILSLVTSVILGPVEKFIAKDHFKIDTSASAKVKIGYLGDDFKRYFLGVVEQSVSKIELAAYRLEKNLLDEEILRELGDCAQTSLSHLWELLIKQGHGQEGILLTNGCANIFYILDAKGNRWPVDAHWYACYGDWLVDAYSVDDPYGWDAGIRVVSPRNS